MGFPAWQGGQAQFVFSVSSNEVRDWEVKSRALQGEECTRLNSYSQISPKLRFVKSKAVKWEITQILMTFCQKNH